MSISPPLCIVLMLLAVACTPVSGGGMGGAPGPGADAGCEPAAGEYTGTWTLLEESDEECPAIEPSSSRFGDDEDADCSDGCTCSRSITEQDDVCVGTLIEECTDDDGLTTLVACALGVSAGATEFGGGCGIELTDEDGTVLIDCRYDVVLSRSGD